MPSISFWRRFILLILLSTLHNLVLTRNVSSDEPECSISEALEQLALMKKADFDGIVKNGGIQGLYSEGATGIVSGFLGDLRRQIFPKPLNEIRRKQVGKIEFTKGDSNYCLEFDLTLSGFKITLTGIRGTLDEQSKDLFGFSSGKIIGGTVEGPIDVTPLKALEKINDLNMALIKSSPFDLNRPQARPKNISFPQGFISQIEVGLKGKIPSKVRCGETVGFDGIEINLPYHMDVITPGDGLTHATKVDRLEVTLSFVISGFIKCCDCPAAQTFLLDSGDVKGLPVNKLPPTGCVTDPVEARKAKFNSFGFSPELLSDPMALPFRTDVKVTVTGDLTTGFKVRFEGPLGFYEMVFFSSLDENNKATRGSGSISRDQLEKEVTARSVVSGPQGVEWGVDAAIDKEAAAREPGQESIVMDLRRVNPGSGGITFHAPSSEGISGGQCSNPALP